MENAYIFSLCVFLIIAVFYNTLWNRRENKGILDKRDLLKIVLLAPILIAISFFIGKFFEGEFLKFILTLGPLLFLRMYLDFKPNSFKQYNPTLKKYGGLFIAVLLAFLITGCAGNKEPENPKHDINSLDRYTDGPKELIKGKGKENTR